MPRAPIRPPGSQPREPRGSGQILRGLGPGRGRGHATTSLARSAPERFEHLAWILAMEHADHQDLRTVPRTPRPRPRRPAARPPGSSPRRARPAGCGPRSRAGRASGRSRPPPAPADRPRGAPKNDSGSREGRREVLPLVCSVQVEPHLLVASPGVHSRAAGRRPPASLRSQPKSRPTSHSSSGLFALEDGSRAGVTLAEDQGGSPA